jgi:hypothetical protein
MITIAINAKVISFSFFFKKRKILLPVLPAA